jgi:phosphate transport system protein
MRHNFEQGLKRLQDDVLVLGSMVRGVIFDSIQVLGKQDEAGSRRLIAYDEHINRKRFAIEEATLTLIATQQPMARDMRMLAAVLEIITELERIGDYAKGIAIINLRMQGRPLAKPLVDLPKMADKTMNMLDRALDAFIQFDAVAARQIAVEDDIVDELYNQIYRELVHLMTGEPNLFDRATLLLWAAHNMERTGDRIVNICERVVFTVTGEMIEISGDK